MSLPISYRATFERSSEVRKFYFVVWALALLAPLAGAKPFEFPADTFSFSNQLYFDYQVKPGGGLTIQKRANGKVPDYSRHCFVMVRGMLQFHKFAEFRPDLPRVSDQEYRQRILQLSRIPVWSSGPKEKVQFPGYADLHRFSADHVLALQKNLGLWWPSFWRLGNWRIVLPVPRSGQRRLAYRLRESLDQGVIQSVYITRFKPINHCLVVYRYEAQQDGDLVFFVCDVNQAGKLVHLHYRRSDESFYFDKSWYYPGGLVNVLPLFVSPLI
jgi:hypothetical protein